MPSSPDTPASRFPMPGSAGARMTPATSGPTSPASLTSAGPSGPFWRTSPDTSLSALKPCCESYATWVTRLRRAYSLRLKRARRMNGSAGSAWPTATPMQTRDGWTADELDAARSKAKAKANNGNGFGLGLGAAATSWQTPVADDMVDRAKGKWNSRGEPKLSGQAMTWGTPRASDAEKGGPNQSFGAGGTPLPAQAAQWPTPAAQNVKGSSPDSVTRADGKSRMDILHYRAEQGFTRPDLPTWDGGLTYLSHRQTSRRLLRSATSHLSPGKLRQWLKRGWWRKRRLNPLFVEWLMAWPSGHALCACSATEFTLWQQDMRGALSQLPMASCQWIWEPRPELNPVVQLTLFDEAAE